MHSQWQPKSACNIIYNATHLSTVVPNFFSSAWKDESELGDNDPKTRLDPGTGTFWTIRPVFVCFSVWSFQNVSDSRLVSRSHSHGDLCKWAYDHRETTRKCWLMCKSVNRPDIFTQRRPNVSQCFNNIEKIVTKYLSYNSWHKWASFLKTQNYPFKWVSRYLLKMNRHTLPSCVIQFFRV